MNTAKFNGYPFTLHTSLPVEECRRRLTAEFYDAHGNWRHAHSNKKLLGWQGKTTFQIYPSKHYDPRAVLVDHGYWDYSRRCTVSFRADASGTTLTERYAYTQGERFLIRLTFGTLFGILFGVPLALLGVILLFQDRAAIWMLVTGIVLVIGCALLLRDQGDGDFPRERDQIARYLMSVLEASVVNEPDKSAKLVRDAKQ